MDARQRFARVARGQPTDRVPLFEETIRKDVLDRWHAEGLDRRVNEDNYRDFFGLDRYEYLYLALEPHRGELKTQRDFERLRSHYQSYKPDFRQERFWRNKAREHGRRDYPLGVMGWRGFMLPLFTHNREWDSLQDTLLALYDHPQLMKDSLELVADCYIEAIKLALRHLEIDFGLVSEPIASTAGPVVSPQTYREFVLPQVRRIVRSFHDHGVFPVIFRSISNVRTLIPLAVEAGVDGVWVNQCGRAVDYQELRRAYPSLLLLGGLDATTLTRDEAAIEAEVAAKVPPLLAHGRYLPALDDNPRDNVPYRNYAFYRAALRRACNMA